VGDFLDFVIHAEAMNELDAKAGNSSQTGEREKKMARNVHLKKLDPTGDQCYNFGRIFAEKTE
jgi:hypothetical protein